VIEIKNIQFRKEDTENPSITRLTGSFKVTAVFSIDRRQGAPEAMVRDAICREIWGHIYGDLRNPIAELQDYAIRFVTPDHAQDVLRICKQLDDLLTMTGHEPYFAK